MGQLKKATVLTRAVAIGAAIGAVVISGPWPSRIMSAQRLSAADLAAGSGTCLGPPATTC